MEINGYKFTIGTDPEHFIAKNGQFVSAFGLIPGTKKNPFAVKHGAVQVDGMATEFNVDPSATADEFISNIHEVRQQLAEMLPGFDFLRVASIDVPEDIFNSSPLEAIELGCDPDFNCYTMGPNEAPDRLMPMRTVGGHVHVGGFTPDKKTHFLDMARLTSLLDEAVGIYSLLWDHDDKRRILYGKAGAFRPKSYGMEWRSLSAMWTFDDNLIKFVFDQTGKAMERFFDKDYKPHQDVQHIINDGLRDHELLAKGKEVEYLRDFGYAA